MNSIANLAALERLYADRGELAYGEGVTQVEHAVQCALLAEAAEAAPSLIVASLLHDLGHLLAGEDEAAPLMSDDRHEMIGARALRTLFGDAVRVPIALHVAAKRWLCGRDPGYADALSPASRASLTHQGGPFDAIEAAAFERRRYWRDAVLLRRFDDCGKRPEPAARAFSDFVPLMKSIQL